MGVGPHQEGPRQGEPLLGEDLVADPFAALKEVDDPLIDSPVPDHLLQVRRDAAVGGDDVVEGDDDPLRVEDPLRPHLAKGLDGKDAGAVVGHGIIHLRIDDLSRLGPVAAGPAEYLLADGCHGQILHKRGAGRRGRPDIRHRGSLTETPGA